MASMADILLARFPLADPTIDYRVEDHGNGVPVIGHWDEKKLGPQPSDAEMQAAIDAYVPPPIVRTISYATMRSRMTDAERQAILTACRTAWQIDDFVRLAQAEGEINLGSETTATAKAALVTAGLLAQDRADAIFAP